jgi:hypothetical protein
MDLIHLKWFFFCFIELFSRSDDFVYWLRSNLHGRCCGVPAIAGNFTLYTTAPLR